MSGDLLKLSWQIQLALGSGYAAYLIAYVGIRASHTPVDTTFSSLVFGLMATAVLNLIPGWVPDVWAGIAAFLSAVAVAAVWRRFLRTPFKDLIRATDLSWSNDDPSALATILADSSFRLSQIAVLTDDGVWLRCDNTTLFADAPFGPCRLGPNGDLALYLTHELSADGTLKELKTVRDGDYGDRITYIPASKVRRITFRHSKNVSRRSTEAAPSQEPTSP